MVWVLVGLGVAAAAAIDAILVRYACPCCVGGAKSGARGWVKGQAGCVELGRRGRPDASSFSCRGQGPLAACALPGWLSYTITYRIHHVVPLLHRVCQQNNDPILSFWCAMPLVGWHTSGRATARESAARSVAPCAFWTPHRTCTCTSLRPKPCRCITHLYGDHELVDVGCVPVLFLELGVDAAEVVVHHEPAGHVLLNLLDAVV